MAHRVALLGAGLIADFYVKGLHRGRGDDRVDLVYSRTEERASAFARHHGIARHTTDMKAAIEDPGTDVVIIGLPNDQHEEAVTRAAAAGKAILCTKPLGRTAEEAARLLAVVEEAGVFAGYLEDLVYTPKTLAALNSVRAGALGRVLWARSRETHPGPHSAWFWDVQQAGGGAIVDLACHCIEVIRSFVDKRNRPVEVMCWADTLVHPIDAEDHAIALIKFASGAIGQFEVSWAFRGGMDLRDEVAGTEGTLWTNHSLRTGLELFTTGKAGGYVAEKAEADAGWLFPVADEISEYGYVEMFDDMLGALDEGREPVETFYDGYVVNAVMDACYRSATSKRWEPVELEWRGEDLPEVAGPAAEEFEGRTVIKRETMPDGSVRMIVKDPRTGEYLDIVR